MAAALAVLAGCVTTSNATKPAYTPPSAQTLATWQAAAQQGNASAQDSLGEYYFQTKDYDSAHRWYAKAADQGDATAQYNMGVIYAFGHGVSKDQAKAISWYRKAGEQGDADAQFIVGSAYQDA